MLDGSLRKMRQQMERETLSKYAAFSDESVRKKTEEECPIRTSFQRDRDRILYSKAFRRLMHKTQVFIAPEGDHYRTRLTHTLEVSQISRTIARALRLNEDLTEAIALGHDLGHAPFGHAGEEALDESLKKYGGGGFHHSVQSLRVVDYLEREGGLNLTNEVRNGILAHTKGRKSLNADGLFAQPMTLEAEIVRISDRIAYINHDIDDAIRAGIIKVEDIPRELRDLFGDGISSRVRTMVVDIIESSWDKPEILMSAHIETGLNQLKEFMFDNVYINSPAKVEEEKAKKLVKSLFEFFMRHPTMIPRYIMERGAGGFLDRETMDVSRILETSPDPMEIDPEALKLRARAVCDFVAGMTDRYAIYIQKELFVPRGWNLEVLS